MAAKYLHRVHTSRRKGVHPRRSLPSVRPSASWERAWDATHSGIVKGVRRGLFRVTQDEGVTWVKVKVQTGINVDPPPEHLYPKALRVMSRQYKVQAPALQMRGLNTCRPRRQREPTSRRTLLLGTSVWSQLRHSYRCLGGRLPFARASCRATSATGAIFLRFWS